jgi:hypothetical protein
MSALIVIPSWAKLLSSEGWTKKKVKEYLAEHSRSPFSSQVPSAPARAKMDIDNLMILVAGGPGSFMACYRSVGGFENALVTKKIELPKSWDKLVAKYKNIVPTHEKY